MHNHAHDPRQARTVLTVGAVATLAYVVLAFVVGWRAHSLALISEAGHNLTDFLALGLSGLGVYLQAKPPTSRNTYGFHRAGVLAALINVVTLFVITVWIVIEAVARLRAPGPVHAGPMLWVAVVGLLMNAFIAWRLEGGLGDVNLRAAFLHMLGDALATALVIAGALVIARTGWVELDPILSLLIAALILLSGWGVLVDALNILLEGAPRGVRPAEVAAELAAVEGVEAVHDLHIWSLGSHAHALSAHLRTAELPGAEMETIRRRACAVLVERYQIRHATLQLESGPCAGCVFEQPS